MKLLKVNFEKYKSITGDDLDIDDSITCLVGINESGKSNVLFALEKINPSEQFTTSELSRFSEEYGDDTKSPSVKIWLKPNRDEEKELATIFGKQVGVLVVTKKFNNYSIDFPAIDYKKSKYYPKKEPAKPLAVEPKPQENINPEQNPDSSPQPAEQASEVPAQEIKAVPEITEEQILENIRLQIVEEIKSKYIPKFSRFDSVNFNDFYLPLNGEVHINKLISDPGKYTPVVNLLSLGNITSLDKLKASNDEERIRRDSLLQKASELINKEVTHIVWPIDKVNVHLEADGDLLKIRLKEERNLPFAPQERSRGLQWTLAFNIYFLAGAKKEFTNSILLIDEPGIFLHINAQKKLLEETFKKISQRNIQIVYTTHLPYLIHPSYPERIRILERDKECTIIGNQAWSEGNYGLIPEPVKTALGLQWSQIFNFLSTNLVVEGPSDQMILRALFEKLGYTVNFSIVPSYGKEKVPSLLALINIEDKNGYGIVDSDADMNILTSKLKKVNLSENWVEKISEIASDKKISSVEDLIPKSIYREAVYAAYENRFRIVNKVVETDKIPASYPRVKNTQNFIASIFGETKHSLKKTDIAKEVIRILKNKRIDRKNDEWVDAIAVCKHINDKLNSQKLKPSKDK